MESASADVGSAALSSYELQRKENMKRNREVLMQLGLETLVEAAPYPLKKIKRPPSVPKPPTQPSRQSSRQAGAKAEGFYVATETAGPCSLPGSSPNRTYWR